MAQRTVSAFKATKDSRYADNSAGAVSAADSRDMFEDTADSFLNITDHLLDEDDMASDSATKVASQQSIKAYVDSVSSGIQTTTVAVSSAEILALNTTPKQLIAAPGAGNVIRLISVSIFYTFGTSAYATFTNTAIEYEGTPETPAAQDTVIINSTQSKVLFLAAGPGINNLVDVENKAVILTVETGDPTAGDGTLDVRVQYEIIAIP